MDRNMTEPLLMPYQALPFNGDTEICAEFLRLRDKYNIENAVETGTCVGGTTVWLSAEFNFVYSIEVNREYQKFAIQRLIATGRRNWDVKLGKSEDKLGPILKNLSGGVIIFLDAHWSKECPLMRELEIIAESGLRPVIAIHDFQVPHHPEYGFDSYNGQPFMYQWLKPAIEKIYGEKGYKHYYNTAFCKESAQRGIIYITPND